MQSEPPHENNQCLKAAPISLRYQLKHDFADFLTLHVPVFFAVFLHCSQFGFMIPEIVWPKIFGPTTEEWIPRNLHEDLFFQTSHHLPQGSFQRAHASRNGMPGTFQNLPKSSRTTSRTPRCRKWFVCGCPLCLKRKGASADIVASEQGSVAMIWLIQYIPICIICDFGSSFRFFTPRCPGEGQLCRLDAAGLVFGSEILETKDNQLWTIWKRSSITDYDYDCTWLHYRSISFSPLVFRVVAADALPLAVFSGLACFEPSTIKVSRFPQTLWLLWRGFRWAVRLSFWEQNPLRLFSKSTWGFSAFWRRWRRHGRLGGSSNGWEGQILGIGWELWTGWNPTLTSRRSEKLGSWFWAWTTLGRPPSSRRCRMKISLTSCPRRVSISRAWCRTTSNWSLDQ